MEPRPCRAPGARLGTAAVVPTSWPHPTGRRGSTACGPTFRYTEVPAMGTVAAGPAARSHSAFVFWTLVALVVCIGLAGQLLGPGSSSQPQRAEGEAVPLPLVEEPTGTLTADWP